MGEVRSRESFCLRRDYPSEFADGEALGSGGELGGEREQGGYPIGFHLWPLARRNAWFAGFNFGYTRRSARGKGHPALVGQVTGANPSDILLRADVDDKEPEGRLSPLRGLG